MQEQEQFQHQRFERKYVITEHQARQIRELLKVYLVADHFSQGHPNNSYAVHSLYLDSTELTTYWATVRCEKRRFKLRVRFYDDNPGAPLFFEIKRRENECVLKHRGAVRREAGASLLAGHLPGPEHMASNAAAHCVALDRFCYLMHNLHAHPTAHVAYLREAWVSEANNSVRVTVDRAVRGEPRSAAVFGTQMHTPMALFDGRCVLELKFTNSFPRWFNELVQDFDLMQVAAPKYCSSIAESQVDRLQERYRANGPEDLDQLLNGCWSTSQNTVNLRRYV